MGVNMEYPNDEYFWNTEQEASAFLRNHPLPEEDGTGAAVPVHKR
jgi:hypothetical protein